MLNTGKEMNYLSDTFPFQQIFSFVINFCNTIDDNVQCMKEMTGDDIINDLLNADYDDRAFR